MSQSLGVCLYLHVHQPYRVRPYSVFDIGNKSNYFDLHLDRDVVLDKVATKSYLPTNKALMDIIEQFPDFKLALSFSGTALEQFETWRPDVLKSFQQLIATGNVELLADTYYHSLAFFYSRTEFERQVDKHQQTLERLFGQTPQVFRNTELSYRNDLGHWAQEKGYKGLLCEGWDPLLDWRSPNFAYHVQDRPQTKLLLKNYKLSDDIAFRFSEQTWTSWPLTADTFSDWVRAHHGNGETVNLFMDYESFGEHQWESSGIFNFLRALPSALTRHSDVHFWTPSEAMDQLEARDAYNVEHILTWADTERDLTAWVGNDIQRAAIHEIYQLEDAVLATGDQQIISDWRRLTTSDHTYYMCTKWFADGDVHAYFSPYDSPYDAHIYVMNALSDLKQRVRRALQSGSEVSPTSQVRYAT